MFGAEDADFELADGGEAVVGGGGEVYEADGGAVFVGLVVFADAGVFVEEVEEVFVIFEEVGAGEAGGEAFGDFFGLVGGEPGVEGVQLGAEDAGEDDFGEGLTACGSGGLGFG